MSYPTGAAEEGALKLDFDRRLSAPSPALCSQLQLRDTDPLSVGTLVAVSSLDFGHKSYPNNECFGVSPGAVIHWGFSSSPAVLDFYVLGNSSEGAAWVIGVRENPGGPAIELR